MIFSGEELACSYSIRSKKIVMKTIASILFLLMTFTAARSQSPVPEPDTAKNQIRQIDPVPQNVPEKNYSHDRIKITAEELPKEVKKTLQSSAEFAGWEKGRVYKTKDGKTFMVELDEANATRTFRFDQSGKMVLD